MKIIILIGLIGLSIIASNSYALDIEDGIKNYEKSGEWASFSITDTNFGMVLATRAVTEDARTNASLVLTYPTSNSCKLIPTDVIVKLNTPVREKSSMQIFGGMQVDNKPALKVEATLQNEEDSNFIFITIDKNKLDEELSSAKSLMVNFKGFGVMNFSLLGAKKAINQARQTCEQFALSK